MSCIKEYIEQSYIIRLQILAENGEIDSMTEKDTDAINWIIRSQKYYQNMYHDLIFAVEKKQEGVSRHQRAKNLIIVGEKGTTGTVLSSQEALK